ncbi:hypothetical protein [Glycomyces dulcitolivorans]|uniref:hypothetical protein n=1 Tax=Glycomyces dulcitolivorans TaxID=2200759 RepID=UPI00130090A0|nr:hypothetical protein [Glycomyces dulcitolivorans]
MRAEFDRLKDLDDRTAFAAAVAALPDSAMRQAMYLLREGREKEAELRAWAAVRPASGPLFRY